MNKFEKFLNLQKQLENNFPTLTFSTYLGDTDYYSYNKKEDEEHLCDIIKSLNNQQFQVKLKEDTMTSYVSTVSAFNKSGVRISIEAQSNQTIPQNKTHSSINKPFMSTISMEQSFVNQYLKNNKYLY